MDFSDLGGQRIVPQENKKKLDFSDLGGSSIEAPSEPSDVAQYFADTGLGVAQGVTLGGADELEGGIKALASGAGNGNPFSDEFLQRYREYQQNANKKYEEAGKRSPWLYGAGQIAGGVATAPLLGASGLAGTATKAGLSAALAEGGLSAAGKALGKAALTDAITAAPSAAAMGSLSSEKNLVGPGADVGGNLTDAAKMAAVGGTIASGASLASNVVPYATKELSRSIGDLAENFSPTTRYIKKAYEQGRSGINYSDEVTAGKLARKAGETADDVIDTFDKADKYFGKEVGDSIEHATNSGVKIDISQELNDAAKNLELAFKKNPAIDLDGNTQKIMLKLLSGNQELTPDEARTVKEGMGKILDSMAGDNSTLTNTTRKIVSQFRNQVDGALKSAVPEYAEAAKNFAQFRNATSEQILSGSTPTNISGVMLGNLKNGDLSVRNKLEGLIQGATIPGQAGETKAAWSKLQESLLNLEKTNPEAFKRMEISAPDLIAKIKNASDEAGILQKATGISSLGGHSTSPMGLTKEALHVTGPVSNQAISLANRIGNNMEGIKSFANAISFPARMTKKALFDLPLDSMSVIANGLKSSGSEQAAKYGDSLLKAIANKDQISKNATLFAIMQNPNLRSLLNLEEDEKK